MPYMNLWGIHPLTKRPSSYISHVQHSEREPWEQKAKTEGWTHLTWGIWGEQPDGTPSPQVSAQATPAKGQLKRKQTALPERRKLEARPK